MSTPSREKGGAFITNKRVILKCKCLPPTVEEVHHHYRLDAMTCSNFLISVQVMGLRIVLLDMYDLC